MRTWQRPGFVTSVKELSVPQLLYRFLEGVARAEGRNLLGRDLHLLAGLGVPAFPGLALPNGELPEACDLDLLASLERFGHHLLEGLDVLLSLAPGHPSFLCDPLDKFLLLHGRSFLSSPSAPWRACSTCLLCRYTRAGTTCPLVPGGIGATDVVGVWRGTYGSVEATACSSPPACAPPAPSSLPVSGLLAPASLPAFLFACGPLAPSS